MGSLKSVLVLALILLFSSCGDKNKSKKQITNVIEDNTQIIDQILKEDCQLYVLESHPTLAAAIICTDSDSFVLTQTGDFLTDNSITLDSLAGYLPVPNEDNGEEAETEEGETVNCNCSRKNIIINGSFEEGHGLGNNQWGVYASIPGWFADTSYVDAPIEIQNGDNIGGIKAAHGSAKLELDSHNKDGYTKSDSRVTQIVDTVVGAKYKLKFKFAPRIPNSEETNRVNVFYNGNLVASVTGTQTKWKQYKIEVTGTGPQSELSFAAVEDNDTLGGYIDKVRMKRICPKK